VYGLSHHEAAEQQNETVATLNANPIPMTFTDVAAMAKSKKLTTVPKKKQRGIQKAIQYRNS